MAGQPEKRFNVGLVKATVWKNVSKAGDEFKTVSVNRSYKDKEGNWKNTGSFGVNDLDKLIQVLEQARDYINGAETGEAIGAEAEEVVA